VACNLGSRMESLRFLIRDRDTKYTTSFDAVFRADDIEILKTPPQAPKANAHCERVIGTLRREILDHILVMNATHAHRVLTNYARHYNQHRPHQARNQQPPDAIIPPQTIPHPNHSRVLRTRVLGGLINEYHHAA
jgi:transposase InsO family protein